jgi:hypothetical protein
MGRTKCNYNYGNSGRQVFYDGVTYETLNPHFPVTYYDDFLGSFFEKVIAGENTVAPWGTVATNLNTAPLLVANEPNGVVQITLDADDNAEQGVIYWSDQLPLDITAGLIFETRLKFAVLPTTGTEEAVAVWGIASATGADLDAIATNAWFRIQSAAPTVLLYESDDATTDDDDNIAGVTMAALVWHIFQIDFTNLAAVRFVVDGVCVGTTDMSAIVAGTEFVQPYFCMSKAVAANNTGTGTMYIDYVRCFQNRS